MSSAIAVAVNDFDVEHVDGIAARAKPNGAEGAFAAANPHNVAVKPEVDALTAELDPPGRHRRRARHHR